MTILKSQINSHDPVFVEKQAAMRELVADFINIQPNLLKVVVML